jgi:ABC-type multidrug transport system fused ATPase/permease subunit
MKYIVWLWHHSHGIRFNTAVRIVAGIGRVSLGLLMVWLCKQFIDVTIRTGSDDDIWVMVAYIVATVMGSIVCRQVYYYLGVTADAVQSTAIRLRLFSHLFRRQMYEQKEMHSGDISSRLEKDISTVSSATTSIIPDLSVTLFQLTGAFLLMQSMDSRLAWMLLLLTPVFILIGKGVAWKIRQMTQDIRRQESMIQMLVQESMEHNAVLRSLESGDWVTGRLDGMQHDLRGKVNHRATFTVLFRLMIATSFSLGYIMAFIWGGLQLRADGEDLAYVTVSLVDKRGVEVPTATDQLVFEVKGAGQFRGVCNGDATSTEVFTNPTMRLFAGKLVVTVQAGQKPGKLQLTVRDKSRKLKAQTVMFDVK